MGTLPGKTFDREVIANGTPRMPGFARADEVIERSGARSSRC
jgi:hypothetical protein